jgi:hypothetical protein
VFGVMLLPARQLHRMAEIFPTVFNDLFVTIGTETLNSFLLLASCPHKKPFLYQPK